MSSTEKKADGGVREISGEDEILAWFRTPGIRTWRYRMYRPGVWSLGVVIGLASVVALILGVWSGLAFAIHQIAFVLLLAIAFAAASLLVRRILFRYRSYVALSEEELLLGRGGQAVVIPRGLLSVEVLRLGEVQRSSVRGALPIEVAGQRYEIHLVGPLVHLLHIEALMGELLRDLQREAAAEKETERRS